MEKQIDIEKRVNEVNYSLYNKPKEKVIKTKQTKKINTVHKKQAQKKPVQRLRGPDGRFISSKQQQ